MKKNTQIKKARTKLLNVNLNEGFIVDAETNAIYAAYHHIHEAIITCAPWCQYDFEIPTELRHYKISNKLVAHFSITGWTALGHKSIATLARPLSKKEKLINKL